MTSIDRSAGTTGTPYTLPNGMVPNGDVRAKHGDFSGLMHLQQHARDQAKQIRDATGKASTGDPARDAIAKQQLFQADLLDKLRELVGPKPGSNARHAFAAVLERGPKGSDLATIRLAIAADAGGVSPAAGANVRAIIAGLDSAAESVSSQASDPSLVQDPARLSQFQQRNAAIHQAQQALMAALSSGGIDDVTAAKLGAAAQQKNPGFVVRDVLAALGSKARA